jgi:3-methyl-2-oxobutanoate hydroxymethyltransferase
MNTSNNFKKNTVKFLQQKKDNKQKISMLTAYDFSFAKIFDAAGIDILLVGDSAANVMAGFNTTLPITLDQMIYHGQSVVRGTKKALVVVDLPFGSYQISEAHAMEQAVKVLKETNCEAIKLEGGLSVLPLIKKMIAAGIAVMGHVGLTPQSIHQIGSFGVQAKDDKDAKQLIQDVLELQEAGCFAIVVEKIPAKLAAEISQITKIPIIGIGAGAECDGQVLVMHDMLGMNTEFNPKFVRKFIDLTSLITNATVEYKEAIEKGSFPNADEAY